MFTRKLPRHLETQLANAPLSGEPAKAAVSAVARAAELLTVQGVNAALRGSLDDETYVFLRLLTLLLPSGDAVLVRAAPNRTYVVAIGVAEQLPATAAKLTGFWRWFVPVENDYAPLGVLLPTPDVNTILSAAARNRSREWTTAHLSERFSNSTPSVAEVLASAMVNPCNTAFYDNKGR